jgi:adenylate kinase
MLNIVLFGPPGAGKGTQSELIIKQYGLVHFSTGDILRAELAANTPLGVEAKKFMEKGALVPDSVVIGMIGNKIEANKSAKGLIFDGFPRTTAQAAALDTIMAEKGLKISGMIALEVAEDELITRLLERGKVSGRADDQDRSIIANRISVYNKETFPVKDFYEAQGKYKGVYGIGEIEEIFGKISQAIQALN